MLGTSLPTPPFHQIWTLLEHGWALTATFRQQFGLLGTAEHSPGSSELVSIGGSQGLSPLKTRRSNLVLNLLPHAVEEATCNTSR